MNDGWYEIVSASTPLLQGDFVLDCPIIAWQEGQILLQGETDEVATLRAAVQAIRSDVVVMTQACDLEQRKVTEVILCQHFSIIEYRRSWEEAMQSKNQSPTDKAWRSHANAIRDGFIWNLALLNSAASGELSTECRIVDFHQVFTVPRSFLESYIAQRGFPRLRLLPPYREHLSQAFARFFMRVGLPVPVSVNW